MNLIKKLVRKNLLLNKKRTIVTIIGMILSVALLSALSTMVVSFRQSLISYQKAKGGDYHVAYFGVKPEELAEFDSNRGIESYFTVSEKGYAILEESKNEYKPYCRVVSMQEEGFQGARLKLIEGRFPENEKEIVIPRHLKTNGRVEYHVGDSLTLCLGDRVSELYGEKISLDQRNHFENIFLNYKLLFLLHRKYISFYYMPHKFYIPHYSDNNFQCLIQ